MTPNRPKRHLIDLGPGPNTIQAVQQPGGAWSIVLELDGPYTSHDPEYGPEDIADFWCAEFRRMGLPVARGRDIHHGGPGQ